MASDIQISFDLMLSQGAKSKLASEINNVINSIKGSINDKPIEFSVGIDKTSVRSAIAEIDKLKEKIADIGSGGMSGGDGLKSISASLTEIQKAATALMNAIPKGGSALSRMAEEGSPGIDSVIDKLNEIGKVIDEINGKKFTNTNIVNYTSGINAAANGLREYKAYANELANALSGIYKGMSGVTFGSEKFGVAGFSKELRDEIYNFSQKFGSTDWMKAISGSDISKIEGAIVDLESLFQSAMRIRGMLSEQGRAQQAGLLSVSGEQIERLKQAGKAYDDAVSSAKRLEDQMRKNAGLSGDAGAQPGTVQNTQAESVSIAVDAADGIVVDTESVKEQLNDITSVLTSIRAQIIDTFDLSNVNINSENIKSQFEDIKSSISDSGKNGSGAGNTPGSGGVAEAVKLTKESRKKIEDELYSQTGAVGEDANKLIDAMMLEFANIDKVSVREIKNAEGITQAFRTVINASDEAGRSIQRVFDLVQDGDGNWTRKSTETTTTDYAKTRKEQQKEIAKQIAEQDKMRGDIERTYAQIQKEELASKKALDKEYDKLLADEKRNEKGEERRTAADTKREIKIYEDSLAEEAKVVKELRDAENERAAAEEKRINNEKSDTFAKYEEEKRIIGEINQGLEENNKLQQENIKLEEERANAGSETDNKTFEKIEKQVELEQKQLASKVELARGKYFDKGTEAFELGNRDIAEYYAGYTKQASALADRVGGATTLEQLADIRKELAALDAQASVTEAKLKSVIKEDKDTTKAKNEEDAVARRRKVLEQNLLTEQAKIKKYQSDYADVSDGTKQAEEFANSLSTIKTALDNIGEADSGGLKDISADLDVAVQRAKLAADELKKVREDKNNGVKLSEDSTPDEYYKALTRVEGGLSRAIKLQERFSATQHKGSTEAREYYDQLGDVVEDYKKLETNLKNGTLSQKDFSSEVTKLGGRLKDLSASLEETGVKGKTFTEVFTSAVKGFAQYFSATRVVMAAYRSMKQMVSESIAINDAMTQLQIVTKASDDTMAKFGQTAFDSAKKLGVAATDVISATTTYARLGNTMEEAAKMAELTTMLQTVGDIEAGDAQSAITAIVKAYDVGVDELESVMDRLVAVGNGAPISVSELATGLNNASSALKAAGNNFNESVALMTAANATIQDASKASTGLRTITARIRNVKSELEDLGEEALTEAKYDEIVQALTHITLEDGTTKSVSLTKSNGELKSTYEIIKEIAEVWDRMSSMDQAALAEKLAGNRQQVIFYSLVEGFKEAENAMKLMDNSAGELSESYGIYMDSATAHINQFKAAFSELSTTIMNSDLIALVVDIGRVILETFNSIMEVAGKAGPIGQIAAMLGIVYASMAAFNGVKSLTGPITGFFGALTGNLGSVSTLSEKLLVLKIAIGDTGVAAKGALASLAGFIAANATLVTVAAFAAAAIVAVGASYYYYAHGAEIASKKAKEHADAAKDAANEADALEEQLDGVKKKIDEINKTPDLAIADKSQLVMLQQESDELERQINYLRDKAAFENEEAKKSAAQALGGNTSYTRLQMDDGNENALFGISDIGSQYDALESTLTDLSYAQEQYNTLLAQRNALEAAGDTNSNEYKGIDSQLKAMESWVRTLEEQRIELIGKILPDLDKLAGDEEYKELYNLYSALIDKAQSKLPKVKPEVNTDPVKQAEEDFKNATDEAKKFVDEMSKVKEAINLPAGQSVTAEMFNSEELKDYTSALEYQNGVLRYNADLVKEIAAAKAESNITALQEKENDLVSQYYSRLNQIKAERETLLHYGELGVASSGKSYEAHKKNIDALEQENSKLVAQIDQQKLLQAAIVETMSKYRLWKEAQSAESPAKMLGDTESAFKTINETLNARSSDLFGRVGEANYKASIDFVIPDTVDKEDQDAINKYLEEVGKYFKKDSNGNFTKLNRDQFIKDAAAKGLLEKMDDGSYNIVEGTKMADFARELNLSLSLVRAIFGEFESFGAHFDWSDEISYGLDELGIRANEAAKKLREIDELKDIDIVVDVSGFKDKEKAIDSLKKSIATLTERRDKLSVDSDEYKAATDVLRYLLLQKQQLERPAIMSVNTDGLNDGKVKSLLRAMQKYQESQEEIKFQTGLNPEFDTAELDAKAQEALAEIRESIEGAKEEMPTIDIAINKESTDEEIASVISSLNAKDFELKFGVDKSLVDAYIAESHTAKGTVFFSGNYDNIPSVIHRPGVIDFEESGGNNVNGSAHANGSAFANGTAYAGGDWRIRHGGTSLVGELGIFHAHLHSNVYE